MKFTLNGKITSTLNGVFAIWMWFALPIISGTFMGIRFERTAADLSGVSYLLLASWVAFTYFSWKEQSVPKSIAAGLATLIAGNYLIDFGISFGLIFFVFLGAAGTFRAILETRVAAVAAAKAVETTSEALQNGQPD